MDLDRLTEKEWLHLAGQAEQAWVDRLRSMAERVRSSDPDLARDLEGMAAEERGHFQRLANRDEGTPWPNVWHIDQDAARRLLGEHFPCLTSAARPRADRRNVTQMVDAVERECARFYHHLANNAADPDTRAFFEKMAALEEEHREGFGAG